MTLRDYITIARRDLSRQLVRSSLTIMALVISTVILVTMAAMSLGGQRAIADQFGNNASLASITVTPTQANGTLSPFGSVQEVRDTTVKLSDATVRELLTIPHIASASPRVAIWELQHFSVQGKEKRFIAQGAGIPSDASLPLSAGRPFSSNDERNVVIVGYEYVKELGLNDAAELINKEIVLTTQKGYRGEGAVIPPADASAQTTEAYNQVQTQLRATIIGVTEPGADQNGLYVPLGWAAGMRTAQFFEAGTLKRVDQFTRDGYSAVRIAVDTPANVKQVSAAIAERGYGQISVLEQVERVQQISIIMWVILGAVALIAAVAAALGVANTMLMTVSEQRYTIGVWRAVGARKSMITRMFLMQAIILGMIGGCIGVGLGYVAAHYINVYVGSLLASQGLSVTMVASLPWWLAVAGIVVTIVFSVLAGFFPAKRAARQDPSAALLSN